MFRIHITIENVVEQGSSSVFIQQPLLICGRPRSHDAGLLVVLNYLNMGIYYQSVAAKHEG